MRKPILISILCVALAAGVLLWGFQPTGAAPQKAGESYALIIGGDTGAFVMQLRKGVEQAASEAGVSVAVCAPGEADALADATGALVWLDDPLPALERLGTLPAVVVGERVEHAVCVLGDDEGAGEALMMKALDGRAPEEVWLLLDDEDSHAAARGHAADMLARVRGVSAQAYREGIAPPDGCLAAVAVSRRATLALAALKQSGAYTGAVLGVDTGDRRVDDLENGWVDAMALDSPYAMGYLALGRARELAATGHASGATSDVLIATIDNMYLSGNVKQVFPLLQ